MFQNPPSALLPRSIAVLLALLGVAALAWQARALYREVTTLPAAPAQAAQPASSTTSPQALQRLFGPGGGVAPASLDGVTLQGCVVASDPTQSHAVFRIEGQGPVMAFTGEEFLPGIRLEQVANDHVQYSRAGTAGRLEFAGGHDTAVAALQQGEAG